MIFIHIDPTTNNSNIIDKYINQGKQLFILFYMEGCGPCNATKPEWKKIKNVLENKYKNNDNVVIADIDQDTIGDIKNLKTSPLGFPTMIYITNNGDIQENYEEGGEHEKNRSIDSFVQWIESKIKPTSQLGGKKTRKHLKRRHKWSRKYKKSINCRRPKGFSQKQYCKYGRRK
jgi:thiol-disulfide isomerase/thioredoxin